MFSACMHKNVRQVGLELLGSLENDLFRLMSVFYNYTDLNSKLYTEPL